MTLSLDEVRNIRFPMARKPNEDGYRASAVDNFMDKLEISYAQLVEEIDQLRANAGGDRSEESESLRADLDAARNAQAQLDAANSQLRQDNDRLTGEVNQLRAQISELRASSDLSQTGADQVQSENEELRRQLEELRGELNQSRQDLAAVEQARQTADLPSAAETTAGMGIVAEGVQQIRVTTSAEASPAVVRLVELATDQAETLLRDADAEAQKRIDEATGQAERVTAEARARAEQLDHESRTRAEQLDQESRQNADRLLGEARGRADRLDSEVRDRRAELFAVLEADRDTLADRVNQLRDYEENYRRTFNGFLQSQIDQLNQAEISPAQRPDVDGMYGLGEPPVATPRLDALVDESRRELN
ncbi:MAG: DivIVA domain-containing protein [Brooklawnia sp.]|jgi:colicin import membrane protein